jgi:hypothetical protein
MTEESPLDELLRRIAIRDQENKESGMPAEHHSPASDHNDNDDNDDNDIVDADVVEDDATSEAPEQVLDGAPELEGDRDLIDDDAHVEHDVGTTELREPVLDDDGTTHETATPRRGGERRMGRRPFARDRREIAVTALVLLLIVAILGVLVSLATRSKSDRSKSGAAAGAAPAPVRDPNTAVFDRFDRPDTKDSLARAETGQAWIPGDVPWFISGGSVELQASSSPHFTAIVAKTNATDGSVQATLVKIANGAGIVFRYRNAFNYWQVVASPRFSTWNVRKVVDGQVTLVGNVGLSPATDGTTIGVTFVEDRITVQVNGKDVWATTDAAVNDGNYVGLIGVSDPSDRARWDNFIANTTVRPTTTSLPPTSSARPFGN